MVEYIIIKNFWCYVDKRTDEMTKVAVFENFVLF